ncbi:EZH inhibitory protein-like [Ostrinia nubilalis]|uniref:EZH inhibitory protein-like n=1 Tax=Ostrinia nubilalis TaxID=29057 RepID=UPI00308265AA
MGGAVSSGRDNNELIDNLMGGNYIRTRSVERVFRALDRADYMTPENRDQAYKDLAWRNGPLHMSAPCIYSEVMEGLELRPGLSFLNVGSGTGYLSTLVGLILGSGGISHGVEVHPIVLEYSIKKMSQFLENSPNVDEFDFCQPKFYGGNGLCLAPLQAPYDRVYCGAGCPEEYQNYFKQLIKVGGILVMPLNDNLIQVRRVGDAEWVSRSLLNVSFATLRVPTKEEAADLIKLEEQAPPKLQILARGVIRSAMRAGLTRRHPELREPPQRPPPAKKSCPRRICIPIEDDSDVEGLNALHDLDRDGGAREMNALLSLVLSMGQNRVAGALRFDPLDSPGDSSSDDEDDDVDLGGDDDDDGGDGGDGGGDGGGGNSESVPSGSAPSSNDTSSSADRPSFNPLDSPGDSSSDDEDDDVDLGGDDGGDGGDGGGDGGGGNSESVPSGSAPSSNDTSSSADRPSFNPLASSGDSSSDDEDDDVDLGGDDDDDGGDGGDGGGDGGGGGNSESVPSGFNPLDSPGDSSSDDEDDDVDLGGDDDDDGGDGGDGGGDGGGGNSESVPSGSAPSSNDTSSSADRPREASTSDENPRANPRARRGLLTFEFRDSVVDRAPPTPPADSPGDPAPDDNPRSGPSHAPDDPDESPGVPAEVEIYLGKSSRAGPSSMDWEPAASSADESEDEPATKDDQKRQKLDSGIGEETTPSSEASPSHPRDESDASRPDDSLTDDVDDRQSSECCMLCAGQRRRRGDHAQQPGVSLPPARRVRRLPARRQPDGRRRRPAVQ